MEDKELRELLEENLKNTKESVRLLHAMKRDIWYRRIFTTLKWLFILGVLAWGYTQVAPYLAQLFGTLESIRGLSESLPQIPQLPGF